MILAWHDQPEEIALISREPWLVIPQDLGQAANMLSQEGK
jgi:hypothetical protein